MLPKNRIPVKTILFFLFVVCSNVAPAQQWNVVGTTGFSDGEAYSQSIALDGETPYVAYIENANGAKPTVMKFDGTSWVVVGSAAFTAAEVDEISFAVSGGIPYVAFTNKSDGKLSVVKYNGTGWVNLGAANFTESGASSISLAFGNGVPYVAFQDWQSSKVSVMTLDGGSWSYVGSAGFSTGWMAGVINIAVEGSTPYVSYRDYGASYKASAMKFNGTNWELLGAQGFSARTHDANECIAVYGGIPYVASWDVNANATVYKFNGSDWTSLGAPIVAEEQCSSQSICFSNSGTLFLVFSDWNNSKKATIFKYDGTAWTSVGEAASLGEATNISIAVSDNNVPYIAYRDSWSMRRTTVMKYSNATQVDNLTEKGSFKVYPNPGEGQFWVDLKDIQSSDLEIKVVNSMGQIIISNSMLYQDKLQIDLSGKASGVYVIQLKTNHYVYSQSVVIR